MELPEYEFFCHAQIVTELNRYNADIVHVKMTERLFRKAGLWYTGVTGERKMKVKYWNCFRDFGCRGLSFWRDYGTMKKTAFSRREAGFLLLAAGAAALCTAMAFWFAVPLRPEQPLHAPRSVPLVQLARVDLNTAGLDALTILPGVGEKRAQAILDYRLRNGAFRRVADAEKVPGLTAEIVASWGELATVR